MRGTENREKERDIKNTTETEIIKIGECNGRGSDGERELKDRNRISNKR